MAPINPPTLLSPAELAYLHSSLSLTPPIRPDSRASTQFRPLVAETDILPGTNGSARVCFADGTEAVVGVKAEVGRTALALAGVGGGVRGDGDGATGARGEDGGADGMGEEGGNDGNGESGKGENAWVEVTIEIPGFRDDDPLPVFLASLLAEPLLAAGDLTRKLYINEKWHWRLYVDILLLSPPLSYPLPLLSLTTHLALLSTRLPALRSEGMEDPLFDDDWDAARPLYPRALGGKGYVSRPPVTLLVVAVGPNIIFDPAREELAVAEAVLAVSLVGEEVGGAAGTTSGPRLLSIRTIDPPSRLTTRGVPDAENSATGGGAGGAGGVGGVGGHGGKGGLVGQGERGVWYPPRGGMKKDLIGRVVALCLKRGGVGEEVLAGLEAVEVG